MTVGAADSVSPVTTPIIVYDENLSHDSASREDSSHTRVSKRGILWPQIIIASSIMALTTPLVSFPDLPLSGLTNLRDQTESWAIEKGRRITLREARRIALQAHYQFEDGLRRDRIQEARLMQLSMNEDEA